MEIKLAPSMMCCDLLDIKDTLALFEKEKVEYLHIDVMDGQFVPNIMLGTSYVSSLRKASRIPLDLHLMTKTPEKTLEYFSIQPGDTVSVHVESTVHINRVLQSIRKAGAHPFVALNPGTPLEFVGEVMDEIEGVLIMSVNPGFAGQKLISSSYDKIRRLRRMLDENGHSDVAIEVDGGLGLDELRKIKEAGANIFVLGTAGLFFGNMEENIHRIREIGA